MNKSESIIKISVALLKAQMNIKSVTKDASNPFFKSKYADLASVINACKEELNAEGITFLQPVDEMFVNTILLHKSGEYLSSLTPIVCKSANNPQDLGSAITYARRYALQSFIGLPAVDDDGEKATDHSRSDTPETTSTDEDDQTCPTHKVIVKKRFSKANNKPYWLCTAGEKTHFLKDPNQDNDDFSSQDIDRGDTTVRLEEPNF